MKIFSVLDSSLAKRKLFSLAFWNNAFKRVQGHISRLSMSICGTQSLKKLNSCFQFIKSVAHGDTGDQAFSEVSSWYVDFPLKTLSGLWQWENAGDGAFCRMYVLKLPSRIWFECFLLVTRLRQKISRVCWDHRWFNQQLN